MHESGSLWGQARVAHLDETGPGLRSQSRPLPEGLVAFTKDKAWSPHPPHTPQEVENRTQAQAQGAAWATMGQCFCAAVASYQEGKARLSPQPESPGPDLAAAAILHRVPFPHGPALLLRR